MIKQFEINNYVKRQINEYLTAKETDLKTAMDDETMNPELAAILHGGFPTMVQKIYSLNKFKTFFWDKRALLAEHIQARLEAAVEPKRK